MDAKVVEALIKNKIKNVVPKRLESLRLPRDLSLGGTKPKKVFVPNVNVARNKDKPKEKVKESLQKLERRRKEHLDRKSQNNRYVQSSGVFSEGSADSLKHTSHGENRSSYKGNASSGGGIVMPTYKKEKVNIDKDRDNTIINDLIIQDEEEEDEKMPLMPVMLKYQPLDEKPIVQNNFLKSGPDECRFSLIQLPDSLCGKGLSDDPKVKKIFDYPLRGMLEGQIGTLQIRKSRKVYLKIGDTLYYMDASCDNFKNNKELVLFTNANESDSSENKFSILGNIHQEYMMSPVWKQLLKK